MVGQGRVKPEKPIRAARGRAAHTRGLRAETLAAFWLSLKAYRIIGRRVKTRAGEIDLVARKGARLVFVEVKARAGLASAAEAVTVQQQARLVRAAALFVAARPSMQDFDMRFDVVLVAPRRWPRHLADAWRP
jgi:putative endonuclease